MTSHRRPGRSVFCRRSALRRRSAFRRDLPPALPPAPLAALPPAPAAPQAAAFLPAPFVARVAPAVVLAALAVVLATVPVPAAAQYRFGISAGGASTMALVAEYRWAHQGVEVQVGTWGFRDASVSVTAKQYVGSYAVEPFVGVGLWGMTARAEAGRGFGLIARFPIGFEWTFAGEHSVAATLHMNRALALRRPDPEDKRPPRTTLIPLPEFSYRWGSPG